MAIPSANTKWPTAVKTSVDDIAIRAEMGRSLAPPPHLMMRSASMKTAISTKNGFIFFAPRYAGMDASRPYPARYSAVPH
ncbi:hypothetical protein SAMN05421636_10219 [Pricia antarctica]|uniref:Uncharacterized protein n=1 Tax=Pricia antarctica TaxID=641691 RepID=A0A1G6XWF5_9FLAO|nr:hypothetical protein SAMN05421636_10219 [Pricia antarctica]